MTSKVAGESLLIDRYPFDSDDPTWPVTADELKRHIQIDHSEDDLLLEFGTGGYLAAAVEYIETRGQVSLINQERRLRLDELPYDETIHALRGPLVSVSAVTYLDDDGAEQTLSTDLYRTIIGGKRSGVYFTDETDTIELADGPGVVWIDMVCGHGTTAAAVPAMWRLLVAEVAAYFYEHRTAVAGGGIDPAMEAVFDRKITIAGRRVRYV